MLKTETETYGSKVNIKFCSLIPQEDGVKCESFTIISTDRLLVYENKCYLQAYLDNCAYKDIENKMTDYLDGNLFESDEVYFFHFDKWVL